MFSDSNDLSTKILDQIEYYFGDSNLNCDKFLNEQIKKDADEWVPLDFLLKFPRLQQLTTDKPTIAAALKNSKIVEVSEDGERVRRNPAVPVPDKKVYWQEVNARTVYIKGFPPETTLDVIMDYLKPHGVGNHVAMQRDKENVFKGSIFATFKKIESAETFVKSDDTKKFKDTEIVKIMLDDWVKEAAEKKERITAEIASNRGKKESSRKAHEAALISNGQLMHIYGLPTQSVNAYILREFFNKFAPVAFVHHRNGSSKAKIQFRFSSENAAFKALDKLNEAAKEESDGNILFLGQKIQCKVLEGEEEEKYWAYDHKIKTAENNATAFDIRFLKGQVLHLSGLPDVIPSGSFGKFFRKYGLVERIVYQPGSSEACIQFGMRHENAAVKASEKIGDKLLFQGHEIQCKVFKSLEEVDIYEGLHGHNSPENKQLSEDEDDTFSVISYCKDVEASEYNEKPQNNVETEEERRCCVM